jgi:hypothetical protein
LTLPAVSAPKSSAPRSASSVPPAPAPWHRVSPAREIRDVVDPARLERQHDLGKIEALHLRQFLRRALRVLALGPQPHAHAGRRAAGAAGALVGARHGDLLDEQRVDAAVRIERAMRASPQSTTAVTPSMVSEVSATLVETMIFRVS